MKKLLSLLIIATIITSSLCVSYFAIDDNSTQNNTTESTTVPVTETSSTVVTTESTTVSTTEPTTSSTEPSSTEPTTESSTEPSSTEPSSTQPKVVKVTSIKLSKNKVTLINGKNCTLKATINPKNATNKKVTWSSSDKKVATVDKNGKVVAKRRGTCRITVSATDGSGVKAFCKVTVKQLVTSIKLNRSVINLKKKGNKATLKATVKPNNANNKKVTWKSKSPKNVSVNKKGTVKALRNDSYSWVFVKASDGSKKSVKALVVVGNKASKVEIGKKVKGKFIKLNNMNIVNGRSYTFSKRVSNKNKKPVVYGGVTWKSSNPKILTIDNKGKIKAIKLGSVNVTATTMDGSKKSVKCKVRVIKPVKKITFNKKNKYSVDYGKSVNLKVTVEPSDASIKTLKWESSNSKVLTVNQKGKVTAKGLGSSVITASATDGSGVKISHNVSVNVSDTMPLTEKTLKNPKTVKKICEKLNNYFKSCGAKIDPSLKGSNQWYVEDTCNFPNPYYARNINETYVVMLEYWIQEMSGDYLNNDTDWNNKGYLEDSDKYADFLNSLEYRDKDGHPKYRKNLILDSKYNGFDWLINTYTTPDLKFLVYVDYEKMKERNGKGKDVKDSKGNQEYVIKFYYDWF